MRSRSKHKWQYFALSQNRIGLQPRAVCAQRREINNLFVSLLVISWCLPVPARNLNKDQTWQHERAGESQKKTEREMRDMLHWFHMEKLENMFSCWDAGQFSGGESPEKWEKWDFLFLWTIWHQQFWLKKLHNTTLFSFFCMCEKEAAHLRNFTHQELQISSNEWTHLSCFF